jgi:spermidine synthase
VRDAERAGWTLGLLYGLNMLGASAGALLTPWVLVRFLGLQGALLVAAAGNAAAGLAALALARRVPFEAEPARGDAPRGAGEENAPLPADESRGRFPLWLALYGLSGFCALALEILWFRLLDVATRSTAFTFGTVLALYLFGGALGCLLGAPLAPRLRRPLVTFLTLQCLLLAWAGGVVILLVRLPETTPGLAWLVEYWRTGNMLRLGASGDLASIARLYLGLPLVLFGPATVLMGLSFPALQRAVQDDPATSGFKVGALQAANIAGCVVGSLVVGLGLLRWLGTSGSLRLVLAVGLVFAAVGLAVTRARARFAAFLVGLAVLAAALPGHRALWERFHGVASPVASFAEDATSVVAVFPWEKGLWHVTVNGKHHSYLPFGGIHTRLGAIPALIHPEPKDVAVIGLGSGDTAWAAACRKETQALTVFEITGPQKSLLTYAARTASMPDLAGFLVDPRLRVQVADGRSALLHGEARYDLIEADALLPYAGYSGNLYSVEFFKQCARRLKPGGLMCTWSPTGRIAASFLSAFPHVLAPGRRRFLLVGSNEPVAADPAAWEARLRSPEVTAYLGRERAEDVLRLLVRMEPVQDARGFLDEEMNRDLFPRDEFLTP